MYQVYSQQKAGRPALAIIASVVTLGVSVLMAAGVVIQRHHIPDTNLGQRIRLNPLSISIRSPAGWVLVGGPQTTSGYVFLENRDAPARRQLEIQRFGPYAFQPPSLYIQPATLSRMLGVSLSTIQDHYSDLEPSPMGDMPGALALLGTIAIQVGVSPLGHIYKIVLDNPLGIRPADLKLLQDVTASIQITEPAVLDDPAVLWESSPYRFESPPQSRFVTGDQLNPDLLICYGDPQTEPTWRIETRLTFLAPGRTPLDLVRNYASRAALGVEPDHIERGGTSNADFARHRWTDRDGPLRSVAVRRLAPGVAIMLHGVADERGRDALIRAEDTILETVELLRETPDLSGEIERGRDLVRRVHRDVAEKWSPREKVRWFLVVNHKSPMGFYRVVRRAGRYGDLDGFFIDTMFSYESGSDAVIRARSTSFLPRTGDAVALTARGVRRISGRESRWELFEEKTGSNAAVRRQWTRDGKSNVIRDLHLDASFLADPLPEWANFLIAAQANPGESFLIRTSGHQTVHDAFWMRIEPLPSGSQPGTNPAPNGLGAIVRFDFDPDAQQWFFDPRGHIREVRFGDGQALVACKQRDVYARFRNARRSIAGMQAWWD